MCIGKLNISNVNLSFDYIHKENFLDDRRTKYMTNRINDSAIAINYYFDLERQQSLTEEDLEMIFREVIEIPTSFEQFLESFYEVANNLNLNANYISVGRIYKAYRKFMRVRRN